MSSSQQDSWLQGQRNALEARSKALEANIQQQLEGERLALSNQLEGERSAMSKQAEHAARVKHQADQQSVQNLVDKEWLEQQKKAHDARELDLESKLEAFRNTAKEYEQRQQQLEQQRQGLESRQLVETQEQFTAQLVQLEQREAALAKEKQQTEDNKQALHLSHAAAQAQADEFSSRMDQKRQELEQKEAAIEDRHQQLAMQQDGSPSFEGGVLGGAGKKRKVHTTADTTADMDTIATTDTPVTGAAVAPVAAAGGDQDTTPTTDGEWLHHVQQIQAEKSRVLESLMERSDDDGEEDESDESDKSP
jgi:hypothetical protein